MHETTTAYLHFDPPPQDASGPTMLQGWLVPKAGHHYADVRIVAGATMLPGVFGIPRRDLAEFFKSERPGLLAGFAVALNLPAGRHRLVLEGLTLQGAWETLGTEERESWGSGTGVTAPEVLDTESVGEGLRVLLRRLDGHWSQLPLAAGAIVRETPTNRHLQHPPRPFHGHLDQPRIWVRSTFGRLAISGWVYHESQPIRRVFASTDLQAVQNLALGRETAFLAGRSGANPLATHCGYDGFIDLPAQLPQPATVRVYAELADGSWHLGSVARFATTDDEAAKQPFATYSPLGFWRAWRTLDRGLRSTGWELPAGPSYWRAMRAVWREYSAQAPRQVPAAPVRRIPAGRKGPVHLLTHNLNHEGAPLFLLEYARHLRRETGAELVVTSEEEGPLRLKFESLGARVQVVDTTELRAARAADTLEGSLQSLAAVVGLNDAAWVVANTVSTWWGVHLASQGGRPVIFYIHESTPPRVFFRGLLAPAALARAEEAFRLADRVSFLTASTQRYYASLSDQANYCRNPGWIDLAAIDRFRASTARETLRQQLGFPPDRKIVINVGTVCERKGQHLFARAVDLLWQNSPDLAASALFLMVGGRATPYDRALADFLAGLGRDNLRVMPETGEIYPYYGAADLFVCSSYEESFPRVILEAMAFALPIVSADVHGIPEMVRPGHEAWLVPAGDSAALAAALGHALAKPDEGRVRGRQARHRVATEYDSRVVLPRHAALARTLTGGAA